MSKVKSLLTDRFFLLLKRKEYKELIVVIRGIYLEVMLV